MSLDHGEHAGEFRLDDHQAFVSHARINRLPRSFLRVPFFDFVANLGDEAFTGGKTTLRPVAIPSLVCELDDVSNAIPGKGSVSLPSIANCLAGSSFRPVFFKEIGKVAYERHDCHYSRSRQADEEQCFQKQH